MARGPVARRWIAVAGLVCASATGALARPSTTTLTCAAAKALVERSGAIVLGTGGQTYDRFVRFESLCPLGYSARPAFAPTRDNRQCYIGFYCTSGPPPFLDW
jgi:hypothetical protein